jgi:hypothetical protein
VFDYQLFWAVCVNVRVFARTAFCRGDADGLEENAWLENKSLN